MTSEKVPSPFFATSLYSKKENINLIVTIHQNNNKIIILFIKLLSKYIYSS